MDYEEVANYTFEEDFTPERSAADIAHEVIFSIFCIVGVCADAAIILTILRFKRMRTIPYIFIANWAIADLCSLIVTPSAYRIISVLRHVSMSPEFMCALDHFGVVLHINVLLFVMLVSVDWFIGAHFVKQSETLRSYHRYIIGAIWIISLLSSGINTGLCMADNDSFLSHKMLMVFLWMNTGITIALQVWRAVLKYYLKKFQDCSALPLTLTTAFGGCWLLAFIGMCIDSFFWYFTPLTTIILCLVFASSVVNLSLLFVLNKDFQACLRQVFKRSSNLSEEANFDFKNPVYKNPIVKDKCAVTLSFDKQDELLITDEY